MVEWVRVSTCVRCVSDTHIDPAHAVLRLHTYRGQKAQSTLGSRSPPAPRACASARRRRRKKHMRARRHARTQAEGGREGGREGERERDRRRRTGERANAHTTAREHTSAGAHGIQTQDTRTSIQHKTKRQQMHRRLSNDCRHDTTRPPAPPSWDNPNPPLVGRCQRAPPRRGRRAHVPQRQRRPSCSLHGRDPAEPQVIPCPHCRTRPRALPPARSCLFQPPLRSPFFGQRVGEGF